ncbi:cellulase family glycosylhydrolase [Pelomyxa schiedti]|nr:cellulase family glycosylhydrolase [Pelomyxa schiedti]
MNRKMKLYVVDGGGDNSVVMLSTNTLNALGLFRGDIVIVSNNGRDTALIALADGTYDDQNVGLPLVARTNLGVDLGRPVELTELTTVQYATRITVLPVEGSPLPQGCNVFDTFLRPYFTDSYRPLGFNAIKVWVDWATCESTEGVFNFESLLQVLSIIRNNDFNLKVVVQVYADSAPEWVYTKYPDGEFVGSNDRHIHSQAAPGFCLDHPGVRALVMNFYKQVGLVTKSYSDLIYAFDVWSEPHVVNWIWFWDMDAEEVEFCYCDHSLSRFRDWLKVQYNSSIDALNSVWYRTFSSWEEVTPPRFGTIIAYSDYLDWLYRYTTDKLAEDLSAKASSVMSGFGNSVIVTSHSASPSVINSPLSDYGTPDDWKMFTSIRTLSPSSGFYGTSIYPYHAQAPLGGRDEVSRSYQFSGEYSASRGNGFFVGELQAGQGATGIQVNVPVTADDHRDWVWSLIAHGAKSIFFYAYYPMNSGYEAGGYGLINLDGTPTDRAISSGSIAAIVSQYQSLLARTFPEPAQVAIMYNPLAYFSGGNTVGPGTDIYHSQFGVYSAFFELGTGVGVDFVHASDVEQGILTGSPYKLLYLPFPIAISKACASALKQYIENGGTVVSEARLAWTDEFGDANTKIPGLDLDQVLRSSLPKIKRTRGCLSSYSYTFTADSPVSISGLTVASDLFEETLIADENATVWAKFDSDGTPAVVEYTYGLGRTLFIGAYLGLAAYDGDPNATKVIQALRDWAGVSSLIVKTTGGVAGLDLRLLLTDSSEYVLVALNRASTSCKPSVEIGLTFSKAKDITTNTMLAVKSNGGTTTVTLPTLNSLAASVVWLY